MKKTLLALILIALGGGILPAVAQPDDVAVEPAQHDPTNYDPTVMIGITYNLNGTGSLQNLGFTGKVISTNEEGKWVGALGATYYPWSAQRFGVDFSIGRNFKNSTALIGYDFLKKEPTVSAGWANTKDNDGSWSCPNGGDYLGGGLCSLPPVSDLRLKQDVEQIATLDNGLKLYSFRYLQGDTTYVGVMAQDLLEQGTYLDAVVQDTSGHYRVRYDLLGLKMITLDEWKQNPSAILL